jgi:hypothetical protein
VRTVNKKLPIYLPPWLYNLDGLHNSRHLSLPTYLFKDNMSLDVALQSVAFYVLSCTTCSKINHRRKAKAKAKRERTEKHELEMEQPGLYRHPSPFSTNPYWTEEIMMGPGPPKKKSDKSDSKNTSQRALNTAGQGSSYASSVGISNTDGGSSPTAVATEGSRISGEGWNLKRYQREDEDLWGHDTPGAGQRIIDAIAKAGSTAGRLLESRLSKSGHAEEEIQGTYYVARNPPVNDLHPPVVSTQPTSHIETRWMLQPPPSAKVMEGKERVRGRAGSSGSSGKGRDLTPLSRQVTEKIVGAKLQRGETPQSTSKPPSSTRSRRKRREKNRSSSPDSSDSSDEDIRSNQRSLPISISTNSAGSQEVIPIPLPSNERRDHPPRPPLSTIVSSSNIISRTSSANDDVSTPLRELSTPTANGLMNTRAPSPPNPSSILFPNINAIPSSIPSITSKFPGTSTFTFPQPMAKENSESVG